MTKIFMPKYGITDTLLGIISGAETIRSWLNISGIDVPWLETIRLETLIKRAHFSTAIEGNPLTLPEVRALAQGKTIPAPEKAKKEVLNYFAALRWIRKQTPGTAITENRLLALHKLLMNPAPSNGVLDPARRINAPSHPRSKLRGFLGRGGMKGTIPPSQVGTYKKRPNYIVSRGKIVYTPPGPKEARPLTLMLLKWLEGPGLSTHPIVAQAIAHYELVRIHPFIDGNGRCARALATLVLYHRGFDNQHLLAIDQFYKEDHEGYYQAIQQVRKAREDLTGWLEYSASAVKDTLERTKRRIQELSLPKIAERFHLTRQQERLLLAMKDSPGLSIREIEKILEVKKVRVYQIINPLIKHRIIKGTKTRPVIYRIR